MTIDILVLVVAAFLEIARCSPFGPGCAEEPAAGGKGQAGTTRQADDRRAQLAEHESGRLSGPQRHQANA
jgi:hypothetical protein